jgi:glucose/arabinose dehydrogenase
MLVIPLSLITMVSACNLAGLASEPPLPTIILVSPTAPQQPTSAAAATDIATQQSDIEEVESQLPAGGREDNGEVPTPTVMPTKEPPAVSTPVVSSIEGSPIPTSTLTPAPTLNPLPPTPTPVEVQLPPLDRINLKLIPMVSGLNRPVYVTHAGDNTGRLFVVEQTGRILILTDGAIISPPFLDIVSIVGSDASEQGLLSVAFHPDYPNNGLFYVNYTDKQGNTVIASYSLFDNPDLADPNSAEILMTIGQPYSNHNGGQISFGPDGYLYIGMGDGGAAGDPQNRAQNLGTVLGKILRIDVDNADPYGAPENNPFVNHDKARPEIWSYGWRNPWRFSFDLATGDMYIADVGQNQFEEVDMEPAGSPGQNYGWRLMEGFHCFNPSQCDPSTLGVVQPVAEYDHNLGCSITGGYVYRGTQFPTLNGVYFYGDFCSGIIWGIRHQSDNSRSEAQLLQSRKSISSFGQDEVGEVYLVDHRGNIFQLGN